MWLRGAAGGPLASVAASESAPAQDATVTGSVVDASRQVVSSVCFRRAVRPRAMDLGSPQGIEQTRNREVEAMPARVPFLTESSPSVSGTSTLRRPGSRPFSPRRLSWILFLNVLILPVFPIHSRAQIVQGWILDTWAGQPVQMAEVSLLTEDGVEVGTALSDTLGFFRLAVTEPGSYLLRAERMGYVPLTDGPLEVKADDVVEVEVRVSVSPVALDSLTVVARRRASTLSGERVPLLEAQGFYDRMREGGGHFIDRSYIEKRPSARNVADLLVGIPGVTVSGDGVSLRGMPTLYGCEVAVYMDGVSMETTAWKWPKEVQAMDVEAIEVYTRPSQVPTRWSSAANGCGVIVIWTRRGGGARAPTGEPSRT